MLLLLQSLCTFLPFRNLCAMSLVPSSAVGHPPSPLNPPDPPDIATPEIDLSSAMQALQLSNQESNEDEVSSDFSLVIKVAPSLPPRIIPLQAIRNDMRREQGIIPLSHVRKLPCY
jgi:hypothetical protein